MDRRTLAVLGLALLVATSGCSLLTAETLEFSASQATVSEAAASAAGYQEVEVTQQTANRTFSAAGQEREVRLTNWVATYQRDLGIGTSPAPGTVSVFATPEVSIAGQTLNPIGSMSDRELLETIMGQYGAVSDVSEGDTRTVTVLGTESTVTSFDATVDYQGQPVDVTIHLTRVNHGGDYVVAVGVHPALLSADQAGVDTMFEGIEHASE